jgi:ABC-type Na+ efflux pump permease subunit
VAIQIIGEGKGKEFAATLKEKLKNSTQIEVVDADSRKAVKARITVSEDAARDFNKISKRGIVNSKRLANPLQIWLDPTLSTSYRWFIKVSISNVLYQIVLGKAQGDSKEPSKEPSLENPLGFLNEAENKPTEPMNLSDFLQEEKNETGSIVPTSLQQNVPGWSLFAMFFIAIPLASGILKERQDGTIKRLLTMPVKKSTLIWGKLIPYAGVNILQFGLMLLVGLYIIPLVTDLKFQLGQNAHYLVLVTIVCALTATSYGIFISCVSKSIEHASALSAGLVICMAALGGIMVPTFAMPSFMQSVAKSSPLYWGHQAYLDVLVREAPLSAIAPKLFVLLAFAGLLLSLGKRRFQWL